jgi:hypothetical protein
MTQSAIIENTTAVPTRFRRSLTWVMARFAATARDETDLDALTAELVRVIQEMMQPEHVSVSLRPSTRKFLPDQ